MVDSELADNPALVFSIYLLVVLPLGAYAIHDVLDARWRDVRMLFRWLALYSVLYSLSGVALLAYIVIQGLNDPKEVGASAVALVLGSVTAWKLLRLFRILMAHKDLVKLLRTIDTALCSVTGLEPGRFKYELTKPFKRAQGFGGVYARRRWETEARYMYISACLLDDDYPSEEGARVRWLSLTGKVEVLEEDAEECCARIALWMRLVLRRPTSKPWKLVTATSPLVTGHLYRASLGRALRTLIAEGSTKHPPKHAHPNPCEVLFNGGDLTTVAIGFFWIASEMSGEEINEILAEMPAPWMRGVRQTGKQLMWEVVMSLLLVDMPEPVGNPQLAELLRLPILRWKNSISSRKVWVNIASVCADAVVSVFPAEILEDESTPSKEVVYSCIEQGVYTLQTASLGDRGFQGDLIGLTLLELMRTSYRSGYMAEVILGQEVRDHIRDMDILDHTSVHLYKAEIVTGLASILILLGLSDHESPRRLLNKWKEQWQLDASVDDVFLALREHAKKSRHPAYMLDNDASSKYWLFGEMNLSHDTSRETPGSARCGDPCQAFASVVTIASRLAPFVFEMMKAYLETQGEVSIPFGSGDPDEIRQQWLEWKMKQAYDMAGSMQRMLEVDLDMTVD